ncbi:MAG: ATP-binding protein [Caldilinea sp.]
MTNASSKNLTPAAVLQTGVDAHRAGRLDVAHRAYLLAARLLLDEARALASPQQREQRIIHANQIMVRAREIEALLAKAQESGGGPASSLAPSTRSTPQMPAVEGSESFSWLLAERPQLRLADVAGLDDVKEQIRLKLIYPFTHRVAAERFRVLGGGGILLYGPPGVGKTYIARAIAGELQAAIFVARSSTLMSKWFGEAEKNIAALFAAARKEERSVIFLDEVEALVARRSGSNSSVMPRVVGEFLAQTQSIGDGGGAMLLLGATNEPWAIDPAALRPGRFDELIYVGLPDDVARLRLLQLNLCERPLASDVDLAVLAERTVGYSGADIAYICTRVSQRAFLDMVEGGVEREIEAADFDVVLAERQPSVTPAQLRRYEQFRVDRGK